MTSGLNSSASMLAATPIGREIGINTIKHRSNEFINKSLLQ